LLSPVVPDVSRTWASVGRNLRRDERLVDRCRLPQVDQNADDAHAALGGDLFRVRSFIGGGHDGSDVAQAKRLHLRGAAQGDRRNAEAAERKQQDPRIEQAVRADDGERPGP